MLMLIKICTTKQTYEKIRRKRLTVTHNPIARGLGNMEVVRPTGQVRHVEGHVELHRHQRTVSQSHWKIKERGRRQLGKRGFTKLTVSVRWSRLTREKRRRSSQQNLRMVAIRKSFFSSCGGRRRQF